jgi:hypothetical protein
MGYNDFIACVTPGLSNKPTCGENRQDFEFLPSLRDAPGPEDTKFRLTYAQAIKRKPPSEKPVSR